MGEFLRAEAQNLAAAVFVTIGLELLRRLLAVVGALLRRAVARGGGPAAAGEESGASLFTILSLSLVPIIGVLAFMPAVVAIKSTAFLMDLGADAEIATLPNAGLLLWTLVVLFIWIQLWHAMGLKDFWSRCRYLLLLVSVPLVPQMLAWLGFDLAVRIGIASAGDLLAANRVAMLLCLGVVPFAMPVVHARALAPVFTWAGGLAGEEWRKALEGLGNLGLVFAAIALVVLFVFVERTTAFVSQTRTLVETRPVAIGAPHVCLSAYPEVSIRLGEQGMTTVAFTITREGAVRNVTIVRSSGYERLDLATVLCVTRWTYRPAMAGGRRVETPWKAQVKWVLH